MAKFWRKEDHDRVMKLAQLNDGKMAENVFSNFMGELLDVA